MKRRIISAVTGLAVIATVSIPFSALAAETMSEITEPEVILARTGTYWDLSYTVNDDGTVTITDCDIDVTSVDVPEKIDGRRVTGIDENAFNYCDSLTSVRLPEGLTSIGDGAFRGIFTLTDINFPDSLTSIGHSAFLGCGGLTNISLPAGVMSIGFRAFAGCSRLNGIEVSENNRYYSSKDGVLFDKGGTMLIQCPGNKRNQYSIPFGVKSIGSEAFAECRRLTDISLPEGVTNIDVYAFRDCRGLTSISLPKGLTNIGYGAFESCSGLTSISLPEGLTSIDHEAFSDCSSLTSISLPKGVTSIGSNAFYNTELYNNDENWINKVLYINDYLIDAKTDIEYCNIKNGCLFISDWAFQNCGRLTSISIPDSVTSIGVGVFSDCSSMTSIEVSDNNTNYTSIDGVLFNKDGSLLIQYPSGKGGEYTVPSGVTSIGHGAFSDCSLTSISMPEGVTNIDGYAFFYCSSLTSISLPDSVTSIGGFAFKNCSRLTDIYYSGTEEQWIKIVIGDDNSPLYNAKIHYNSNISGNSNSTSDGAPIINSATLRYDGTAYDIFSQAVTFEEDSDIHASVEASVNDNGNEDVRVYITQGVKKDTDIDITGITRDIIPGKEFSAGNTIYILAVDTKTGKSTSKATKLKISEKSGGKWDPSTGTSGFDFKVVDNIEFTIPDSVVFPFGGMEISFGLDFIPITFEYENENKINIAFGIDSSNVDETTGRFKGFSFEDYKATLKSNMKKSSNGYKAAKNNKKLVNSLKKKYPDLKFDKVKFNVSKGIDMNTEVMGYAEASYVDGSWHFNEGFLALNAEVSYEHQGQAFIWVVPCYYEFGGELGAGIEGSLKNIDLESFKPVLEGYVSAKVGANIGAGVGVAKVCTVGASGEGSLNLKTAIHNTYMKAWGEGDANLKVKVLGKTVAQKNFAHGEFIIYETGNKNALIADKNAITLQSAEGIYDAIDVYGVYPNEDRQYVNTPTEWFGNEPVLGLMSTDYTNKSLRLIADNVYTEAKPQLCEIDGIKVMTMQWDNRERADADRAMLVYSVYDEENKTWSRPVAVDDDGTADFYPCFKDGWIVWQNEKTTLTDDMTLADIAKAGEIYAAKWNGSGFDAPIAITDNDTLDTQPCIAKNQNGGISVAWTVNSENDILGISGTNSVMQADIDENGNITINPIRSELNAITDLSAGNIDGNFCVAYVCDDDNDLNTIDDRNIRIINNGRETQLTDNSILDSNPVFIDNMIYYYSDGNIAYSKADGSEGGVVFSEDKTGLTDSFVAYAGESGDIAIWWTKAEGNGAEVYTSLRKNGEWSDEIKVTNVGNRAKYPCGLIDNDGSMLVAFNNAVEQDNEIIKTDLYTISVVPSYELELTDAYFDETTMTAYATLKNTGELDAKGIEMTLTDSETLRIDSLKAGASIEIELSYNMPEAFTPRNVTLSMMLTNGEEYNTDNNSVEFEIGHADIKVGNAAVNEDKTTVSVDISNIGYSDASAVRVQLCDGSTDGAVIAEQTIDLAVGASQSVTFNIDVSSMRFMEPEKKLYIAAGGEFDEIQTGNNDAYVMLSSPSGTADYEADILNYSSENGKTVINSVAVNNTALEVQCDMYTAVYDSSDMLKGAGTVKADIGAGNDTGVDVTVLCELESGDTIKTFMWNGQEPLSKAAETTVK